MKRPPVHYLLPGLGADRRIFARLQLDDRPVHYLDWPGMPVGSRLKDFAMLLAGRIDATEPHVLVGMSMGGMVAQELAAITRPRRTVIISSWKGPHEMPPAIRLLRGTHPERLLTKRSLAGLMPMVRWQMGADTVGEQALLDDLVKAHTIAQLKVQINACLAWEGPARPLDRLLHIHGDRDRLMPIGCIKDPVVIRGGGHFMVYNMAAAVRKAMEA